MGKYDVLRDLLRDSDLESVEYTFLELEAKLGMRLPRSAFKDRPWWGNGPMVQAKAWQAAGYVVDAVNLAESRVRFRQGEAVRRPRGGAGGSRSDPRIKLGTSEPIWPVMQSLSRRRPAFHSEADFQFELAWEMKLAGWTGVRLERPFRPDGKNRFLDLAAVDPNQMRWAIELKYWTREIVGPVLDEPFSLKSLAAHDLSRYAFCKDIQRVEGLVNRGVADMGRVITLTNESIYVRPGRGGSLDEAFRLHEGRTLRGKLDWSRQTATTEGLGPLELMGSYDMAWAPYSHLQQHKNGRFWVLDLTVKGAQEGK